jgi:hypothetical protein
MSFDRFGRVAFALLVPLLLTGCILTPGKFVSSLTINKDRSFTFAYKGEVIAVDPAGDMTNSLKDIGDKASTEEKPDEQPDPEAADKAKEDKEKAEDTERKRRAVAEALTKEAGYRSVEYLGKGKYVIDYEVSGVISHNFIYPFNQDAEIIFPFIMVEVRQGGTVRMRAPGFANNSDSSAKAGMGGMSGDTSKFLDGVFTLDTDAEIVSQNNEEGAAKANGRSIIKWRATPLTKDAPSAVLRFAK